MKNKTFILIIIIIAIIVIIYLNRKRLFGKSGTGTGSKTTTGNISLNNLTIGTPKQVADRLYQLMKGITIGADQTEVSQLTDIISKVDDSDFIAVWDAFGKKDGDNLSVWVSDEWYVPSDISNSIKNRAQGLGLN